MKEKILYTIINMLLALSFGLIALVAGEAVGVLMGLISFITILYGVYAFFEYGAAAGVVIVLIGVGLNGLSTEQTQKIAYIVAGVVIVLFAIYCFAAFGLHRTTFSRILGVLYPIAMILGAYGLVWKPSFENFLTLASGLLRRLLTLYIGMVLLEKEREPLHPLKEEVLPKAVIVLLPHLHPHPFAIAHKEM